MAPMRAARVVVITGVFALACGSPQAATQSPSPTPVVFLDQNGTGDRDRVGPFTTTGDWQLVWSYDCSRAADRKAMVVAVFRQTGPGSAAQYDNIAPGQQTTQGTNLENRDTMFGPSDGTFYLRVVSGCSWRLKAEAA
jgi:hypothetical protein